MSDPESTPRHTRRRVLALAGSGLAAALAGCSGGTGGERNGPRTTLPPGSTGTPEHLSNLGGPDRDYDHELGTPGERVTVTAETANDAHYFGPGIAHVAVGGTVRWTHGSGAHSAVAYHPDNADRLPTTSQRRMPEGADPWATPELRSDGDSAEHTFEIPGVYDYCCTVPGHEALGMVGRIVVGDPALSDQPAMWSPPDGLPDFPSTLLSRFNERTRAALGDDSTTADEETSSAAD